MTLETPLKKSLVKVYDLRTSTFEQRSIQRQIQDQRGFTSGGLILGSDDWWNAVSDGRIPTLEAKGIITRVWFKSPKSYQGPMFRIGKGADKSEWMRKSADDQLFKEGKFAIIKYVEVAPPAELTATAAQHGITLPPTPREYEVWVES